MSGRPPEKVARNRRLVELHESGLSINEIVRQIVEEGYDPISPQRAWRLIRREVQKAQSA